MSTMMKSKMRTGPRLIRTMPARVFENVLNVGMACNLSGVVIDFAKVMDELWKEARTNGHGTAWVNTHPLCKLYADKISQLTLTHTPRLSIDAYQDLIETCRNEAIHRANLERGLRGCDA